MILNSFKGDFPRTLINVVVVVVVVAVLIYLDFYVVDRQIGCLMGHYACKACLLV